MKYSRYKIILVTKERKDKYGAKENKTAPEYKNKETASFVNFSNLLYIYTRPPVSRE